MQILEFNIEVHQPVKIVNRSRPRRELNTHLFTVQELLGYLEQLTISIICDMHPGTWKKLENYQRIIQKNMKNS